MLDESDAGKPHVAISTKIARAYPGADGSPADGLPRGGLPAEFS